MNLYSISCRYQQLLDQEEYTDEDMKELATIHGDIEDQCIERGKYIRNREAELAAVVTARKEMQEREKSLMQRIDRNELRLAEIMQDNKIDKITKSPLFSIKVKHNPVSVDDYDAALIPKQYWRVKVTETELIDKALIKSSLESGVDVPGARLVSKLRVEFK